MSEMTTKLDIVTMIEKNPITKLSGSYQNRLLSKIKDKFTNDEQQMFVGSFYGYLNYNPMSDFVIDLDNIWKWLDFSHKDKAKRLLDNNFKLDVDYKCFLSIKEDQKKSRGGHNKETILLTIKAFKMFCLKAGTKKADEIHEYYIKLEETLHEIVNEESNELKLQLEDLKNTLTKNDEKNSETIETLKREKYLEKQSLLLREFGTAGAIVYVIRVKSYENGEYVIKIGESRRGIEGRYNEHKSKYEECVLLDCFMVRRSRDFEMFLHYHSDIAPSNFKNLPGHENEKELFIIGKKLSYGILLNIIKKNINRFNESDVETMREDIHEIKALLANNQNHQQFSENTNIVQQLLSTQNILLEKIAGLERTNQQIMDKLNKMQTKTTTGFEQPLVTVGPRLQKINPDTLQLIKVYETVTECMKEDSRIKRPSINKAIEENKIYNGFRWAFVDRELDPSVLRNIQPTKVTKIQNLGYIAKINSEKTQIINVYLDRKTAAIANGYSSSGLDAPVKNVSITNGHYYMLYDKCEDELRGNFEARINGEPTLYKDGVGQFDTQNNLVREFVCKYDCIRSLAMSDKTLAKALDKNIAYNGHYYKSLDSKTQCFA
jgi:hypothetical protein